MRWSFNPEDSYKPYKRKRRQREEYFTAPEHARAARHMERAYPVSDDGRKMVELGRQLVLDPRPEILQPKRTPIHLGVDM